MGKLTDEEKKQRHRAAARAWALANPERVKANQTRWRQENPDRARQQARKATRKRLGHADATGETRSGPCEICGTPADPLHRDHDHTTGRFRGWLCRACNQGLGHYRDDATLLEKACAYLRSRVH